MTEPMVARRSRPRAVAVVPIAPSLRGNGLAMRAARLVRGLAQDHDVHVAVLPVAGALDAALAVAPDGPVRTTVLPLPDGSQLLALARAEMTDGRWRDRLRRVLPLPASAPVLSPAWADTVAPALERAQGDGDGKGPAPALVCAMRYGVLPVARELARRWDVPLAVDLDDDDVGFLERTGAPADASALDRLLREDLAGAVLVTAAGPTAARAIATRLGRDVAVVPNGVPLPADPGPPPPVPPEGRATVLFVANFSYAPNAAGAAWLVRQVLPSPRLRTPVRVELVGPGADTVDLRRASADARHDVVAIGPVPDLGAAYAAAHVVVAPVPDGGGTSTKVLEAAAHRRPVVATPAAAVDLPLTDGEHLRVAADPDAFAAALDALLADPALADRMATAARAAVAGSHTEAHAEQALAALVRAATGGTGTHADGG